MGDWEGVRPNPDDGPDFERNYEIRNDHKWRLREYLILLAVVVFALAFFTGVLFL